MKVCIFDEGFIPGLGRGPFRTPIEISEDKFFLYKQMGLKVINAEKTVPIVEAGVKNRTKIKKTKEEELLEQQMAEKEVIEEVIEEEEVVVVEETVEEEIPEEVSVVEEEIPEEVSVVEEEIPEETVEEITETILDEELPEVVEIDLNSLTKKELITYLTEAGIDCNNNMTKATLIELATNNL